MFIANFSGNSLNLISISVNGGVWFQAQSLSSLLTVLSIYFINFISLNHQTFWYISLALLMLAVGCRPFQICFFAVLLRMLFKNLKKKDETVDIKKFVSKCVYFLIAPASIAVCYALYNYIRFDNPLEFGHNYLPEFVNSPKEHFNVKYVLDHVKDVLRLPYFNKDMSLTFPLFDGFAFYIANPLFILFFPACSKII